MVTGPHAAHGAAQVTFAVFITPWITAGELSPAITPDIHHEERHTMYENEHPLSFVLIIAWEARPGTAL